MAKKLNLENMMNTTVGVEIEMTGITREAAARIAAATFGDGCRVWYKGTGYHKWTCTDAMGRDWDFVSDSSIRTTGSSETACELNTPPIIYAEVESMLQPLVRALKAAGAVTGARYQCGCHIHVSGKGHDAKSIRNLCHLFYAKDELIRKALNVTDERVRWCQPIDYRLVSAIKSASNLEALADAWYGTYAPYESRTSHYNESRYHILNLHRFFSTLGTPANTVEVRAFNASLHAGVIRSYILLVLSMNAAALEWSRVSAKKDPIMLCGNEKFAMRTWLNRMGWTGEMFKNPHAHLIKNLSGDAAWRFGKNGDLYRSDEALENGYYNYQRNIEIEGNALPFH